MTTREASHAGSWYTASGPALSKELKGWLAQVPSTVDGQQLPIPGARVIIAPHAGYAYSGPAAAWAYATLDLTNTKRIFLLGPSHSHYLPNCALSTHASYDTPLGPLAIDTETTRILLATKKFETMLPQTDETEHSLEMHLPYIHHLLSTSNLSPDSFPLLVPVLVGNTSPDSERDYGKVFAPYLADPTSVFIISSDFCHWGSRFNYTFYIPEKGDPFHLHRRSETPTKPRICDSIGVLDRRVMDTIESGTHEDFLDELRETSNTVCGRHPIGVIMATMEALEKGAEKDGNGKGKFKFVRYERSSEAVKLGDSSVSYASAYAVV